MSPVWDLPQLAGELQDWYNRISQIWAKEQCQTVQWELSPTRAQRIPSPSPLGGQLPVVHNESPMIYLKLRKCSLQKHPPTQVHSEEQAAGEEKRLSRHISQLDLLGARSRPPSRPRLPLGRACTHGVVVLCNDRRVLKVAFTPVDFGALVGEYARHRWAAFVEGRGAG